MGRWVLRTLAADFFSIAIKNAQKDLPVAPSAMAIRARMPWNVRTTSIGSRIILTETRREIVGMLNIELLEEAGGEGWRPTFYYNGRKGGCWGRSKRMLKDERDNKPKMSFETWGH